MFSGDRINFREIRKEDIDLMIKYQADPDVIDNYFMSINLVFNKEIQ